MRKSLKEHFARFAEQPTRESFRELVKNHLGESDAADFKAEWPAYSKVARHVLAIANHGGGMIIFGINQDGSNVFSPVGIKELKDKAEIARGIDKFLPDALRSRIESADFCFEETEYPSLKGKRFQILLIGSELAHLPYVCAADGEMIRKAAIYVRKGTESIEADYSHLQELIDRRLESGYSGSTARTLQEHLAELKALCDAKPAGFALLAGSIADTQRTALFGAAVDRLIEVKMKRILERMK